MNRCLGSVAPLSVNLCERDRRTRFRQYRHIMSAARSKVTEGGRVVIPAALRRQLGLEPGTEVVLDIADGALRVRSVRHALESARSVVREHVPSGVSLADELIRERHEAGRRE
jgi:AbrB family looped-hinge helix DNA binding protein